MGNYSFWADLKEAKEVEKQAVKKIAKYLKFDDVEFNEDYRYDFKVFIGDKERTYEVKNDMMSSKTGNLALEYECRGKDSGINSTLADYWIYKLEDGFYQISVEKIKKLVEETQYFRTVVGGDRGSNTKMFLFRLPFMKKQMMKL